MVARGCGTGQEKKKAGGKGSRVDSDTHIEGSIEQRAGPRCNILAEPRVQGVTVVAVGAADADAVAAAVPFYGAVLWVGTRPRKSSVAVRKFFPLGAPSGGG